MTFFSKEDAKEVSPSTLGYLIMGIFSSCFAAFIYIDGERPPTFGEGLGIYIFGIFIFFAIYGFTHFIGDIREGKTLPGTWRLVKKTFKRAIFGNGRSLRK